LGSKAVGKPENPEGASGNVMGVICPNVLNRVSISAKNWEENAPFVHHFRRPWALHNCAS
jgi:hypothetical protein